MTNKLTILAPKLVSDSGQYRQRWQVAYDGRIMGDDRGYSTEADCRAEIEKRIAIDARDAVKYDRPVQYTAETPAMTDKPTPRIEIIERANMRKFGTLFEVVVNGAKLMRADGSARRYASREAAQKAGEAAAMTDKDDATHYLITPNGAVPVIADDEVHAMQIARQMGIANIVSRIDPAMTAAQWDAATVEDIKDDQDVRHTYATAPDRWADFLVTGNGTGLPMSERAAALAWVERLGLGRVVAADGTDLGEHAHHSAWQEWPVACTVVSYMFQQKTSRETQATAPAAWARYLLTGTDWSLSAAAKAAAAEFVTRLDMGRPISAGQQAWQEDHDAWPETLGPALCAVYTFPRMSVATFMANTATAPAVWGPYLVDGKADDLTDSDRAEADRFIKRLGKGRPVEAGPTAYLEDHDALPEYPLACTCAVYTFTAEA